MAVYAQQLGYSFRVTVYRTERCKVKKDVRLYKKDNSFKLLCLSEDQAIYEAREENELPKRCVSFKMIDLFCGAGGMTLGFTEAFGHYFKSVWSNDFNKYCVETYNANFGNHCIGGDIVNLLQTCSKEIPKADVVIGGPPCQGFIPRAIDFRKH